MTFLRKDGSTWEWDLKKSIDGISWTLVVTEDAKSLAPSDCGYAECITSCWMAGDDIVALNNIYGEGTIDLYDLSGSLLASHNTNGFAIGVVRDNGLSVFSGQYSGRKLGATPYCANISTYVVATSPTSGQPPWS